MEKKQRLFYALTGALAGLLSGLLGTGGGLVVVPMLLGPIHLEPKRAFATSVCIMLPICAVSAGVYLWQGRMTLAPAWPYMAGGCVSGIVCGKVYGLISSLWLRRLFGLLLLYGGLRSLFAS